MEEYLRVLRHQLRQVERGERSTIEIRMWPEAARHLLALLDAPEWPTPVPVAKSPLRLDFADDDSL